MTVAAHRKTLREMLIASDAADRVVEEMDRSIAVAARMERAFADLRQTMEAIKANLRAA